MNQAVSETTPCPLCEAADIKVVYGTEHWAIGNCKGCGLTRQNPRLTEAHMRETRYDGEVQEFGANFCGRKVEYEGIEDWQTKPLEAYRRGPQIIDSLLPKDEPRRIWVDVGASTGQSLTCVKELGFEPKGVEIGGGQAKFCREFHGFDVFHGTLTQAKYESDSIQVVSYFQVLEHIHDLYTELAEARRVLEPGGLLLIEVPHYGGTKRKFDRLRRALRLKPASRMFHNVPEHLYYFRIPDLETLLDRAGFSTAYAGTFSRWRANPNIVRRLFERVRQRLLWGNKIRFVARK